MVTNQAKEPNPTAEVHVFEGLPPTPPPAAAVSYNQLVELSDHMKSKEGKFRYMTKGHRALKWFMETNQGPNYEDMFRPLTQVVDLTLEDTVMIGAMHSKCSFKMDEAGN